MIDSRAGRVLEPGGRSMVDPDEWRWITEHARGGFDHLLIGTSLPLMMAPALHYLEAWNEAVCDGAWGGLRAKLGEKIRQGIDLEHWAAFRDSFEAVCELLREVGAGGRGRAPASIVVLSGDVHHAYLAEVGFPAAARSVARLAGDVLAVPQPAEHARSGAPCAPASPAPAGARPLAGTPSAGVPPPPVRWRFQDGDPRFDNQIGTLELAGRRALARLERACRRRAATSIRCSRSLTSTLG